MYIIITHNTPLQQAKDVSSELFKISRPVSDEDDVTSYLFGWVEHPETGEVALRVDPETIIPVHKSQDASRLVTLLEDDATEQELLGLKALVDQSNSIRFGDIIPSVYELKTKEELEADGWFPKNEEV